MTDVGLLGAWSEEASFEAAENGTQPGDLTLLLVVTEECQGKIEVMSDEREAEIETLLEQIITVSEDIELFFL